MDAWHLTPWHLSGKCGFERIERCYDHVPEGVLENDDYKLIWDFSVRTDHEIGVRRPGLMIINPLRPSIKLQILLLCFHTFLTEVVGRSC